MKFLNKKKRTCEQCGSENLKARRASYPLKVGKRDIEVRRVSLRECLDCHKLMLTEVGQEKVNRCREVFVDLLRKHNVSLF
jgi:YgiT-type zinc finger domain-containing protein